MCDGGFFGENGEALKAGHARPCGIAHEEAGEGAVRFFLQSEGHDPVHAFADEHEAGLFLDFESVDDFARDGFGFGVESFDLLGRASGVLVKHVEEASGGGFDGAAVFF